MKDWTPVEVLRWTVDPGTKDGAKRVGTRVELNRVVPTEWHAEFKKAWATTTAAEFKGGAGDTLTLQVDVNLIKQARAHVKRTIEKANAAHVKSLERDGAFTKKVAEKAAAAKAYKEDLERKLNED